MSSDEAAHNTVDRRTLMAALSAGAGGALAGCMGDGGDGDGSGPGGDGTPSEELGERVPEVVIETFSGAPGASESENVAQHAVEVLQEDLGVQASAQPKELVTMQDEIASDARNHHFNINLDPPYWDFLEPITIMEGFTAEKAGSNSFIQNTNYASCEFSNAVIDAATASDDEEKQEAVNQALSAASEDVEKIPYADTVTQSSYRTDLLNIEELGALGINDRTPQIFWNAELTGDADSIVMNISPGNITSPAFHSHFYFMAWSHYPYSALTMYDLELNRTGGIASDWEFSDDATTLTMDLREEATFHDGNDIIAEDVQWNWEWIDENAGPLGISPPNFESVEVVNDKVIEFNFQTPSLDFTHQAALYGIVHPQQYQDAGAEENPTSPDIPFDNIIGSGPYEVRNFEPESLLDMTPFDDHWASPNEDLVFQGFFDIESARRAFLEGEISVIQNVGTSDHETIEQEIPDQAENVSTEDHSFYYLGPQNHFGPTKFREFREAFSYALDRDLMNEYQTYAEGSPITTSTMLGPNHPWYPENPDEVLTESASGTAPDVEQAQAILEEAGWGWDEDGNLHYPQDADLEPLWPQGESAADYPDEWPCVEDLPP